MMRRSKYKPSISDSKSKWSSYGAILLACSRKDFKFMENIAKEAVENFSYL
jgi:hypothetical protein